MQGQAGEALGSPGPSGSTTLQCDTGPPAIASFSSVWGEGAILQHSVKLSQVEILGLDDDLDNSSYGKRTIKLWVRIMVPVRVMCPWAMLLISVSLSD